jgi:4-aminobutyrate--pyruvate transaminase
MGARLRAGFERFQERFGIIGDIRGKGLLQGMEFVRDPATKARFDPPIGTLIGRRALENGLLTRFDPHWLAMGPPLVTTADELDLMLSVLERSIEETLATL